MARYEFDRSNFTFRKVTASTWHYIKKALAFLIGSVSLAILYYAIFAAFISTDSEKKLIKENRLMKEAYPQMLEQQKLIGDAIASLEIKDERIYDDIFHAQVPSMDPVAQSDLIQGSDTIPDRKMHEYIAMKTASAEASAGRVEENFRRIFTASKLSYGSDIPMRLPLDDISYAQVGASVGQKVNPYFKVPAEHRGIDLIATQGNPVYATAAGVVADVTRSNKGDGNVVTIEHEGGYRTRYAHLGEISVSKGQRVKGGAKVGTVGLSGNAFAPHLHYEIARDTVTVDPVHYFFSSLSPDQYASFLYMATNTGQSLD